jgi:hypothetical protein
MSVRFGGLLLISAALAGAAPALPAESRIEKTLRLEPGGTFTLQADLGRVRLTGTDRPAHGSSSPPGGTTSRASFGFSSKKERER